MYREKYYELDGELLCYFKQKKFTTRELPVKRSCC